MSTSSIFGGISQALANPRFRLFWIANGTATIGRWVYRTAVMWLAWDLTKSTTWLGAMAFADVFPMIVLSVFAGAISDRIGYARVIKATQLCFVLVGAGFTVLIFFDVITIWLVLALTICHGIIEAMSTPPRLAMVSAGGPEGSIGVRGAQFRDLQRVSHCRSGYCRTLAGAG